MQPQINRSKAWSKTVVLSILAVAYACTVPSGADAKAQSIKTQDAKALRAEQAKVAEPVNRKFADLSFGVGLSATIDTGHLSRVDDAFIDGNGVVRVNTTSNIRARVMLESHYFFGLGRNTTDHPQEYTSGIGPFVALQPGDKEIISAIGAGVMVGFRRGGSQAGQSFNLGLGFSVDPTTKTLGNEFRENEPAPTDVSGRPLPIRFKSRDQGGLLLLASFSWD